MPKDDSKLPAAKQAEVDAFLRRVAAAPAVAGTAGGRLIFALDATASRQPTWDQACRIQAEMFLEAGAVGGLAIQTCYFRGHGEFRALPWATDSPAMVRRMTAVTCLGGTTQIARVLRHALAEAGKARVNALVYVGDCMEESADVLAELAGKLSLLGVPAFVFQEGDEPVARRSFQQMARLTNGAYMRFDAGSAQALRDLLRAVAVYAAGGRKALSDYANRVGGDVLRLTHQLK
ncbi:MAG TPA: hypothetical protein VMU42_02940 [Candidatus Sulfotelmatobacter sp.]|nr:hypothetical protein [Candidatus Sulfotelmatobacter sp.]